MDKPISVGDLVQVIRPTSCGHDFYLGLTFRVERITGTVSLCEICNMQFPYSPAAWPEGRYLAFRLGRLKRIPPLEELEGEKRDEEITA